MATTPIFWDSCELYNVAGDTTGQWERSGNVFIGSDGARARTGTQSIALEGAGSYTGGGNILRGSINSAAVCFQFAYYFTTITTTTDRAIIDILTGTSIKARVITKTSGRVGLRIGLADDSATSATNIFVVNSLNYVEVAYYSHATEGYFKVWVNGDAIASFTGNTVGAAGNVTGLRFRSGSTATTEATRNNFSDFAISEVTGPTNADDDRLGPVTHTVMVPTSDVAVDGTPSTGTDNFAMVDETPNDGDTTYMELAAPADADLYGHSSTLTAGTTPLGVAVFSHQRLPDGGTTQVRARINNSTTTANGTDTSVSGTYAVASHFWEQSPFTTAAWTKAEVEALRFGVEARA